MVEGDKIWVCSNGPNGPGVYERTIKETPWVQLEHKEGFSYGVGGNTFLVQHLHKTEKEAIVDFLLLPYPESAKTPYRQRLQEIERQSHKIFEENEKVWVVMSSLPNWMPMPAEILGPHPFKSVEEKPGYIVCLSKKGADDTVSHTSSFPDSRIFKTEMEALDFVRDQIYAYEDQMEIEGKNVPSAVQNLRVRVNEKFREL